LVSWDLCVWGDIVGRVPKLSRQRLTPRQNAFLDKLFELYQEHRAPVHYTDVAARLGVNRFSAYDMLKVLERKGFATSSYALAAGHSGPGRSIVVFAPTREAAAFSPPRVEADRLDEEWRNVRAWVLKKLRETRGSSHREVLIDLVTRLPEAKAPLTFCTEMIGALLLNMERAKARGGELSPFRALAAFRASDHGGLEMLAGLSVGATLSADDELSSSITQRLLDQAQQYQASLSRLSDEARSALAQFVEEALDVLD
jgi:hypothetical protein